MEKMLKELGIDLYTDHLNNEMDRLKNVVKESKELLCELNGVETYEEYLEQKAKYRPPGMEEYAQKFVDKLMEWSKKQP